MRTGRPQPKPLHYKHHVSIMTTCHNTTMFVNAAPDIGQLFVFEVLAMARYDVGCGWYGSMKKVDFTHEHHGGQRHAQKDANKAVLSAVRDNDATSARQERARDWQGRFQLQHYVRKSTLRLILRKLDTTLSRSCSKLSIYILWRCAHLPKGLELLKMCIENDLNRRKRNYW
jgi:hypothetical protein